MAGWDNAPQHGGFRWWSTILGAVLLVAVTAGLASFAFEAGKARQHEEQAQVSDPAHAPAPAPPTQPGRRDDPCTAAVPTQAGAGFGGVVRHVIDGDSLCVGPEQGDGATWIEVRLMDFDAPEGGAVAEETLSRLVLGRPVECVVTPGRSGTRSWDRTHAVCRLEGAPVGDLMRAAGVAEGGN